MHDFKIRIRHWWRFLWIRKDELDVSLEMDAEYMSLLSPEQVRQYLKELDRRRAVAHEIDLDD